MGWEWKNEFYANWVFLLCFKSSKKLFFLLSHTYFFKFMACTLFFAWSYCAIFLQSQLPLPPPLPPPPPPIHTTLIHPSPLPPPSPGIKRSVTKVLVCVKNDSVVFNCKNKETRLKYFAECKISLSVCL